jgi:alpha-glucosidase
MSTYSFVNVDGFTPGYTTATGWIPVGPIASCQQQGNQFVLTTKNGGLTLVLSFLSPTCFRVRFNPSPIADFSAANDLSYGVVNKNLGAVNLTVTQTAQLLTVNSGAITVSVALDEYSLKVYRPGATPGTTQLIHADYSAAGSAGQGLIYIPGQEVIANIKQLPTNALYFGLGEKAGSGLVKNHFSFTNFNYDNFTYQNPLEDGTPVVPGQAQDSNPLNPAEPLYNSTPFLIEVNPNPVDEYAGNPYAYGIYFDSVAQSYFNIAVNAGGENTYYFGALYGFMDYYFMAGNVAPDVIAQFVQLTGPALMPPKYVFGYHQGCYGYFDRYKLTLAANRFREASIPCDGLHIDVDFQDNYRTFTSSDIKFPNAAELFTDLKTIGFKCSTNITSLITANPLDENGSTATPYPARDSGFANNAFLFDTHEGQPTSTTWFLGTEFYGTNPGIDPSLYPPNTLTNPARGMPSQLPGINLYSYPPYVPNAQGIVSLGSYGYYPDLGDPAVRTWWGQQYTYILSLGIEMIWQDMTCPALATASLNGLPVQVQVALPGGAVGTRDNGATGVISFNERTFPLDLMLKDLNGTRVAAATIHNGYVMNLLKATSDGLVKLRPTLRTFIIARGGFAGTQRYGGLWTGDSASSWDFLNINIPEVLNIGMSGQPVSGTDIGGFASGSGSESGEQGNITEPELLTRWMTMGALLPWYRNHYDGYVKAFQEPYAYPEPVPTNCRKWIEIRYRLLQVFYDAMYQATQTGMPIARALFLNDPQDQTLYSNPNQCLDTEFFVGHDILVAPILQPQSAGNWHRDIYLPAGSNWYAFQNDEHPLLAPVNGGPVSNYYAPLNQDPLTIVPVYVRAGAIVPMRTLEQWVGQLPKCPLTFDIYPGAAGTYQLYLDDGVTTDFSTQKAFRLTTITQSQVVAANRVQTVQLQRTVDNFLPLEDFYFIALLSTPIPLSITANGQALPPLIQASSDEASANLLAESVVNAGYYNQSLQTTFIKIFDVSPNMVVVATFPPTLP